MMRRTVWITTAGTVFLLGIMISLAILPQLLYPPLTDNQLQSVTKIDIRIQLQQAQGQLQNGARSMLLQAVAGLLVVVGAIATWRQVQVNREGHITERFTRAIDQLGSDKFDTRIGGLYALERIARDSKGDRVAVAEIIAAFLRSQAQLVTRNGQIPDWPPDPPVEKDLPWLRDRAPDIHAAITILGRHPTVKLTHRLSLSRLDLRRAYLSDSNFSRATIRGSSLAACWARRAQWVDCELVRTDLRGANLEYACLNNSQLRITFLDEAILRDAQLVGADLSGASMRNADLRRANFTDAKIRKVDLRDANLFGAILSESQLAHCQTNAGTIRPDDISGKNRGQITDTDGIDLDQ